MTIGPRVTATGLLVLAVCAGAACDLERWRSRLAGGPPLRHADMTQREAEPQEARSERVLARVSEASESAPSPRSSFNRISSSSSTSAKKTPSALRSAARTASREIQPGSRACENARSAVQSMESYVDSMEREVERLENEANDVEETVGWREHYERRLDAARERLEQAEDNLSDYIDGQRQQGVPPGCLR